MRQLRPGAQAPATYIASLLLIASLLGCGSRSSRLDIAGAEAPEPEVQLPLEPGSVRFAVIGDSGTGGSQQYEVAQQMAAYHRLFPFEFVLMLGDNLYGRENPDDYEEKFELPYQLLQQRGVRFFASLGNHDDSEQRFYGLFNMGGERFYSFEQGEVEFFALDSNYMDPEQLEWLERSLARSRARWKICFFHHPIYSSGARHGPDEELREHLEPLFLRYGVDVVFAGHEHFYERIRPQKGILYFISGAAAKLRRGNVRESDITAQAYDQDRSFLLIEIAGDRLHFQAISRNGRTVDAGQETLADLDEARDFKQRLLQTAPLRRMDPEPMWLE